MPFLKQRPPTPPKSKKSLASRVRKDKTRGEKVFHFQLIETSSSYWLFSADRKLVQKFPKSKKVSELRQKRDIRNFALALFLKYEGSQEGIGGYTYD